VVRIIIASEYARPWPGGISEHVHHEAAELTRRGHHVTVLTGPATGGWIDEGVPVVRVGRALTCTHNGARNRLVLGPGLLLLRRTLRRLRPDVVHVHAPLDPSIGLATTLLSPAPVVGTFHASFAPSRFWALVYRGQTGRLCRRAWRRLAGRVAVSEEARRSIARYLPGAYDVIPNGVDLERFAPPDQEPDRPTVLFAGRPDPRKGLPILLEAFERVLGELPEARLTIVGPERAWADEALPHLCSRLRNAVDFRGLLPADEVPGAFAACHVFCSPATGGESQGIVLLEAMACRRPVVCFDIPGYRDVVRDGVEALLVGERSAGALAHALTRLLRDRALRERLGAAGLTRARAFAWSTVVDRLEPLLTAGAAP
jgi:phosphatidyl-myo-inositol alpha-mannosyltransferase